MRVLGMQDLVNIVRQQGAKQIVIVEALDNWFQTIGSIRVQDPNVVYSVHQYFLPNIRTPTSWDLKFGNFSQQVPLFIGEWAVQVHTIYPSRCSGLTPTQATQLVNEFLAYMQQKMVSWTAYDFGPDQLIVNYNYTPTELTGPWTCGDLHSTAGMGNLILQYLTHGLL
jgi:hypothetical protein